MSSGKVASFLTCVIPGSVKLGSSLSILAGDLTVPKIKCSCVALSQYDSHNSGFSLFYPLGLFIFLLNVLLRSLAVITCMTR